MHDNPRSNNPVEGWHRAFLSTIQTIHVIIGGFVIALKNGQVLNETMMVDSNAGRQSLAKKRKKYRNYDARLKNLVQDCDKNQDVVVYLRGIAHNIEL